VNPEVQRLFAAAMELPEEQRAPCLASQTAEADVRNEVFSLLMHDSLAEPFFANVLGSAAASLELTPDPPARRPSRPLTPRPRWQVSARLWI
jgi:hypothetical protein